MSNVDEIVTGTKSPKTLKAKETLKKFVARIDKELEQYFDSEIKNAFGISRKEKELSVHIWKHIKEHNLRPAKRLRGSFVYFGYKLLDGKKSKDILQTSMSIELIHTSLLIQDDFMDQDETRRGKPTTHEYYRNYHILKRLRFNPLHYGESIAAMAVDIALLSGFEIISHSNFPNGLKIKALNRTLRGIKNTAYGQTYDVNLEALGQATEKDIIDLHLAKTAIYTYENPLHIGAILAGGKKRDLELISEYAIPGGIAFQLQDDILGLFGDPVKTGKPAHSDLRQGKMTLLIIKALEKGNKSQKKRIKEIWGKRALNESEANEIRKIVTDTGSLDYSRKLSIKWAKKAQEAIPKMFKRNWNKKAIEYLDGIAQYMIERDN
jgi:geranylgeranyl diphosphate synthase type I